MPLRKHALLLLVASLLAGIEMQRFLKPQRHSCTSKATPNEELTLIIVNRSETCALRPSP